MLIAQVTDCHLGFEPANPDELNRRRLDAVLDAIRALEPAPDLLFVAGDLTEHGDTASYGRLREALAGMPCAVHLMLGNHDRRTSFAGAFPEHPFIDGFLHYVVDTPALRCIALDTLEEGRHGGGFCARRAAWLRGRLAEAPDTPTLILLHHPPVKTGIAWMDTDPAEPWVARLAEVLAGQEQVVGLIAGHVHRTVMTRWRGLPVFVCPSTSPEIALSLAPIDPEQPDGRPLIVAGAPGYALHHWDGERLLTHVGQAGGEVLASYGPALQPMVRSILAERP